MSTDALSMIVEAYDKAAHQCPFCHREVRDHNGMVVYMPVQRTGEAYPSQGGDGRIMHRRGCLAARLIQVGLDAAEHLDCDADTLRELAGVQRFGSNWPVADGDDIPF